MGRTGYEGTGMLPGMDDESKPVARPRIRSGPGPRRDLPVRRIVFLAIVFLAIVLGLLYGLHRLEQVLIGDPRFALNGQEGSADTETLEIAGAAHASERKIQAVFADDSGRSVYLMPLAERREALRTVDWVKDASVVRLWPNRVVVRIFERVPVAFVALSASRFGLIDEDGVILPSATDRFEIPVLAGVRAGDPAAQRRDRVHKMLRLTRDLGAAAAKISRVDVSDPDNLKVTQPWDGRVVTLLLGDRNFGQRYQSFIRNYPEIQKRLPDAATLDMRLEDRITVVE